MTRTGGENPKQKFKNRSTSNIKKLPTQENFRRANGHKYLLISILRSHQIIDHMMNYIILENIFFGDIKEIERISFMIKVELCIGMGCISSNCRETFVHLNRIRNKSIHNFLTRITKNDANHVINNIPHKFRENFGEIYGNTPGGMVRLGFLWIWAHLAQAVTRHRDEKVRKLASAPILERASEIARKFENRPLPPDLPDVENIVKEDRERRKKLGEY